MAGINFKALPCPESGGIGCPECAQNFLKQVQDEQRRRDFAAAADREIYDEACVILTAIAVQNGERFDPRDQRVTNALRLCMDVLRYQRNPVQLILTESDEPVHGRWEMLEL